MGERLLCKQEVVGSIPSASTTVQAIGEGASDVRTAQFEDRWKEPQHGYVGKRSAKALRLRLSRQRLRRDHGQVKMKCK